MNRLHPNRFKMMVVALFFVSAAVFCQEKKSASFDVKKDVAIELNTSHTNIKFETWNKNRVEVEAFIEGEGLSKQEIKELLDNWNVSITGNSDKVTVSTDPRGVFPAIPGTLPMKELEQIGPMVLEMVGPMLESLSVSPFPEGFMDEFGGIQFDYEAYEKNPEKYMKQWEEQMESKFGKEFEAKMEVWAKNFEKDAERMEKDMKAWEEKFGKEWEQKMEAWGEDFGKKMEAWGENFAKQWDAGYKTFEPKSNAKVKRNIIIKMPKNAKLELNVRHGNLKLADQAINIKANLNYTKLTANSIDGANTSILAAYAPVSIQNWNQGNLELKFVDQCTIGAIGTIHLNTNSSDVYINSIKNKAFINGSFGKLELKSIGSDFISVDFNFENSEALVKLPQEAFDFLYNGSSSKIKYPTSLQVTQTKSQNKELIKGYQLNKNAPRSITVTARFSDLIFQ